MENILVFHLPFLPNKNIFMNSNSPFVLLVIQATPFCNLDCKYCYLPDRLNKKIFDINLIPSIMDNLEKSDLLNKELNINWHAGEPTVLSPSFYENVINEFEKYNKTNIKIQHSFQTNATLINSEYCELIKKYDISIGVSIDGPKFINDENRLYRNGRSSFEKSMNGIELLKKNQIKFSLIAVLTEYSLNYPDEMFEFFNEINATSIGFNVEEKEGCHRNTSMDKGMTEKYKDFFQKFILKIQNSDIKLQQREYLNSLSSIIYQSDVYKNGLVKPLSTITIDIAGNYTVFSPELLTVDNGKYIFGNVKVDLFNDIFKNDEFNKVYSEILEGVEMCKKTCDYFNVCGGGSPSNKLHENGTFSSTETNYCIYNTKIPTEIVLNELEKHQ
ncbi:MAG: GRRM system radical SAM/SPASM domain protein [Cytophagales bacterium]|nr:MAG: GRRM system radical SAM/SPASM domain protein [Cytophagales bacterium]